MGSKWRKVKLALGLNLCVYGPRNLAADSDEDEEYSSPPSERRSSAALLSPPSSDWSSAPPTPAAAATASSRLRLSKSFSTSRSSTKNACSICLASMRPGDGQAIFTAECSHSFHFHCITSNVKHGNEICPVCRAKWKEIPVQGPNLECPIGKSLRNPMIFPQNNEFMTVIRRLPPRRSNSSRHAAPACQSPEPLVFNDDESLDHQIECCDGGSLAMAHCDDERDVNIKTFTEVPAVRRSSSIDSFTVLLHLKAPSSNSFHDPNRTDSTPHKISQSRAPVDLVTVLDISGSMAGTKLALLKRAMGFVIQNLGPNDRLAVIAFSSTARRLFPLRRMSEVGKQEALLAVNSLIASGGTNIAEGLRKAAKTVRERKEKNPVASIILLSDGRDTYTMSNSAKSELNYQMLLPSSSSEETTDSRISVHAFGFGTDHDASSLHSVSEVSGGTFSFIETEGAIQDAFAQCIGGLLSVVIKDLQVRIETVDPRVQISSMKVGSYPNHVSSEKRTGSIDVGDLYADEERDFLVSVNIPAELSANETPLLIVRCGYEDPLRKESVTLEGEEVRINRTEEATEEVVSIEVDRQKNRVRAAEAISEARNAAESGDLVCAVSILDNCRKVLSESVSAKSCDRLCIALDAELKEMQERMSCRALYEASGRAYMLSGLSSHSWQRATTRGDNTDGSSLAQAYQTPSMVEMLTRSQAAL